MSNLLKRVQTGTLLGLLHGCLLPLLLMVLLQSRLGCMYLLIPTALYLTVGSDNDSEDTFMFTALMTIVFTVASWADAV